MARLVHPRRSAALAFALALFATAARPVLADGDPYKQHMDNGVKLYTDKNYPAAIAEFQAAYDARPNPNPLVNIALCDKEMFRYPEAIAALVKALGTHGDAMDPADKKAAEDAIKEMRALLGKVTVNVTPPNATIVVDGDDVASADPVLLGPGKHTIAARADGYATAEQTVTVVSGRELTVNLALVAEKGRVTIEAPDPRSDIAVDDRPVGHGHWSGLLVPGPHVVRLMSPDEPPYTMEIVVAAGVSLVAGKGFGGVPVLPPKPDEPPARRGFYVLGLGSMLFAATHPPDFPGNMYGSTVSKPDYGAGYGVRAGFQVNKFAGFDATYEHSSIFTYAATSGSASDTPYYRIVANRVAVSLRLISVGDTIRFVGSFGGGFTYDDVTFNLPASACPKATSSAPCYLVTGPGGNEPKGVDAFALAEAGMELDIDRVLLDFGLEAQLQSTGNLTGYGDKGIFGSLPLINGGPAIRVGYRFW